MQDQVREIRQDLPRKYYLELPKLADGPFQGYPRVYLLARELIAHTAGRIDLETLVDFASAYQRVAPLSIGEIWAIPIMLRLALVEELRRLADGVVAARRSREKARRWQRRAVPTARRPSDRDRAGCSRTAGRRDGRLSAAFVVELLQWLRDQPSSAAPAWQALQRALEAQDDSADEMLRLEHQREAADQLAIGNVITSMRLAVVDRLDAVLRARQPRRADAARRPGRRLRARWTSRRATATATRSSSSPSARGSAETARGARGPSSSRGRRRRDDPPARSPAPRRLLPDLARPVPAGARRRLLARRCASGCARFVFRHPALGYLGAIAALHGARRRRACSRTRRGTAATGAELWLVALLVLLPVSELVISLVNSDHHVADAAAAAAQARACATASPPTLRTMVVVPAIVDSEPRLDALLDDLEVRFLGNRDAQPALRAAERLRRCRCEPSGRRTTPICSRHAQRRIDAAERALRRATGSSSSTASGAGTRAKAAGWAGSASAAS